MKGNSLAAPDLCRAVTKNRATGFGLPESPNPGREHKSTDKTRDSQFGLFNCLLASCQMVVGFLSSSPYLACSPSLLSTFDSPDHLTSTGTLSFTRPNRQNDLAPPLLSVHTIFDWMAGCGIRLPPSGQSRKHSSESEFCVRVLERKCELVSR